MSTYLRLPTPRAALPWTEELFADMPRDAIPRIDGDGSVSIDTAAGAYEVMSYATLAQRMTNQAFEHWDTVRAMNAAGDGPGRRIESLALADYLQLERQVATILPLMAQLYQRHGLSTSAAPEWMDRLGINWAYMDRLVWLPSGGVRVERWEFLRPSDWVDYAEAQGALIEAAIDDYDASLPPSDAPMAGVRPMGFIPLAGYAAWQIALLVIGVVGTVVTGYILISSVNRVFQYLFYEREMLANRMECADEYLAQWVATGDERALEAYERCHDEAEVIREDMGFGRLATWIALGALGYGAFRLLQEAE